MILMTKLWVRLGGEGRGVRCGRPAYAPGARTSPIGVSFHLRVHTASVTGWAHISAPAICIACDFVRGCGAEADGARTGGVHTPGAGANVSARGRQTPNGFPAHPVHEKNCKSYQSAISPYSPRFARPVLLGCELQHTHVVACAVHAVS